MNFFEHQDRAKRKTKQLILLLTLAVISLVAITTFFLAVFVYFTQHTTSVAFSDQNQANLWYGIFHALSPLAFFWITIAITSVVCCGSLFRFLQLQGGGRAVAESMGGRLLIGQTQDADERKILNVVEEIAIASGTAVPPVYLIEDDAINAFAAGYKPQDAVIGITRGCIHQLSRDELQGVIAHEFSHIFHGDMRLNMRLIALLYGILLIGLIGAFLVRYSGNRSIIRSSKDKSPAGLFALGAGLWVIGYTGTFFGNLIKSAVSRQREFLADSSAVQFTRNPDGIAGALKKIGGSVSGSELHNEHASEFSHMYFSQGVKLFFNLMATHPPLEERIKRIQPNWDGDFAQSTYIRRKTSATNPSTMSFSEGQMSNSFPESTTPTDTAIDITTALDQIAQPTSTQIDYARDRLAEIPPLLKEAAQEPFSARGIVIGLLLDRQTDLRRQQLELLANNLSRPALDDLMNVITSAAAIDARLRLPLIELCVTPLKQLSPDQHRAFMNCLELLINADQKVSLMEWAIYRIVLHNTDTTKSNVIRNRSLRELHTESQLLLSLLAYAGAQTETQASNAFVEAQKELNQANITLLPRTSIKLTAVDIALEQLNLLKPLQKPQLLKAMSRCILHDGEITITEAELFRAIADSLDCPIPPLMTQKIN
jgi:Zn-dependent protease with chaperone function/uncharacterized tellurite resistance protein B-like protein